MLPLLGRASTASCRSRSAASVKALTLGTTRRVSFLAPPPLPPLGKRRRPLSTAYGGMQELTSAEVADIARSLPMSANMEGRSAIEHVQSEQPTPTRKTRKPRARAGKAAIGATTAVEASPKAPPPRAEPDDPEPATPSTKRKRASRPAKPKDAGAETTPSRRSTRARRVVSLAEPADTDVGEAEVGVASAAETETPRKRRRRQETDEPVVYVIPPVERRETTFRGRLGYACLNTILRAQKPEPVFCSRTCRLDTIAQKGIEFAKELGLKNAEDLARMIEWNEANKIRFMRISSDMFPFASHAAHRYSLAYAQPALARAGALARAYGHRLTTHPGQFTQLASPKPAVVDAGVRELAYQCEMLDRMGIGRDGVMIVHMGGVYGDKASTIARFRETYTTRLSDAVRARLVLENDELCYNVDDLLPISEQLDIPIVLDWHHDWIYPSTQPPTALLPRILAVWQRKRIRPKQHLSAPRPGAVSAVERRAHADRCERLPEGLPDDMDLMVEAKDKEQAVFHLWRIYGLEEPLPDSLRPPAEVQELATKGRKSGKGKEKGKVKKTDMGAASASEVEVEPDEPEDALTEPNMEAHDRALVDLMGDESDLTEMEEG